MKQNTQKYYLFFNKPSWHFSKLEKDLRFFPNFKFCSRVWRHMRYRYQAVKPFCQSVFLPMLSSKCYKNDSALSVVQVCIDVTTKLANVSIWFNSDLAPLLQTLNFKLFQYMNLSFFLLIILKIHFWISNKSIAISNHQLTSLLSLLCLLRNQNKS